MNILSALGSLVKGKVLVTALVGAALVGGGGVALASTPPGHTFVDHLTGMHATVTPTHYADRDRKGTATACEKDDTDDSNQANGADKDTKATSTVTATATTCTKNEQANSKPCPGLPDTQQLATKFSLSNDSKSSVIQLICSLHNGTFQGTVDGKRVTINHPLGYGEIAQLLAYAQSLAKKNNQKLTDSNVLSYVATALKNCASTTVEACVDANMLGNHGSDNDSNRHNTSGGQPPVIPTPHVDGKPDTTPPANK